MAERRGGGREEVIFLCSEGRGEGCQVPFPRSATDDCVYLEVSFEVDYLKRLQNGNVH